MGVPLGDGSQKKFNWASELSTIFQTKPIVVFGGGLLRGIAGFLACLAWFKRRPVARGLKMRICCKCLFALGFAWFKRPVTAEMPGMFC